MRCVVRKLREINSYIKDNFLKLSIVLFTIYILTAIIFYVVVVSLPPEYVDGIIKELQAIFQMDSLSDKENFGLFWELFLHNLGVSGTNIVSAIIPFLLIEAFLEGDVEPWLFGL